MNLIDNGIKKVISIERIITDSELCFLVKFIDYYDRLRERKVMNIKNIENLRWIE